MKPRRFPWGCLLCLVAVGAGAYLGRRTWGVYRDVDRKADVAERQAGALDVQRERLVREEARATSTGRREAAARAAGWMRPGEEPAPK